MGVKKRINLLIVFLVLFPFNSNAGMDGQENEIVISIHNPVVDAYMKNVSYDDNDYSYSSINYYTSIETDYRKDQPTSFQLTWNSRKDASHQRLLIVDSWDNEIVIPLSKEIQSLEVSNFLPNRNYKLSVVSVSDAGEESEIISQEVSTVGQLRMIKCNSLINVRDIGGWAGAQGKPIKYSKILRGSALNQSALGMTFSISEEDRSILLGHIGVDCEIDLSQTGMTESPLGPDIRYVTLTPARWNQFTDNKELAQRLSIELVRETIELLEAGHIIYVHCFGGADRTGVAIATLLALLGVSESDIMKDYELTSFSIYGMRERNTNSSDYPAFKCLPVIKMYEGDTLSDKWINFLKEGGLQDVEVEKLRTLLLEDYSPTSIAKPKIEDNDTTIYSNNSGIYDISGKKLAPHSINHQSNSILIIGGKKLIKH